MYPQLRPRPGRASAIAGAHSASSYCKHSAVREDSETARASHEYGLISQLDVRVAHPMTWSSFAVHSSYVELVPGLRTHLRLGVWIANE